MRSGDLVADRFEIVAPLGQGGSGTVYRALDRTSQRTVALKILSRPGDDQAERFAREAKLLSLFRHPAIVAYLSHGWTDGGDCFLAMEWVDGQPLSAHLAESGVTLEDSVALIGQIARGLALAHRVGAVHRDIKPQNILVPGDGPAAAKLIDFGIARSAGRSPLTATGALVGTPPYMAPEQAAGLREIGPAADVFALGCVLYECASGVRAFPGENLLAIRAKVLLCAPPPLRALRPEAPAPLETLVGAMMAKAVERRPADAAAVLAALDALPPMPASERRRSASATALAATHPEAAAASALLFAVVPGAEAPLALAGSAVAAEGGRLSAMAEGSALVHLAGSDSAAVAERAVRCAHALRREVPGVVLALTMHLPGEDLGDLGAAIDRGAHTITPEVLRRIFARWAAARPGGIRIDEATARLLAPRIPVSRDPAGHWYLGEEG